MDSLNTSANSARYDYVKGVGILPMDKYDAIVDELKDIVNTIKRIPSISEKERSSSCQTYEKILEKIWNNCSIASDFNEVEIKCDCAFFKQVTETFGKAGNTLGKDAFTESDNKGKEDLLANQILDENKNTKQKKFQIKIKLKPVYA